MKNMTLYSYANKTHFHQKGFVQSFVVVNEIFLELGNGLLTSYFCLKKKSLKDFGSTNSKSRTIIIHSKFFSVSDWLKSHA